jgi:hypothetical protein
MTNGTTPTRNAPASTSQLIGVTESQSLSNLEAQVSELSEKFGIVIGILGDKPKIKLVSSGKLTSSTTLLQLKGNYYYSMVIQLSGTVTSDVIVDFDVVSDSMSSPSISLNNTVSGFEVSGLKVSNIRSSNIPSGATVYITYVATDKELPIYLRAV